MSWITHGLTAIAISVAAVSSTAAQNKIVIGTVGTGNTLEWPLYIAEKKGYFDQEKFAPEWVGIQSSAAVMQQLAAGSLNLGTTGLADALRAPDKGAPTRLLRIGVGVSPYEAIGARTVKSWTDCAGSPPRSATRQRPRGHGAQARSIGHPACPTPLGPRLRRPPA
jgi:ABC-type taurine transport system substrate-binding protein